MNGLGNAFIWAAIACGPVLLLVLGVMALVTARHRIVRARAVASHSGAPSLVASSRLHRA